MGISFTIDTSGALRKLETAKDQIPFATALALTRTAQQVQRDLKSLERSTFKNPRRFTINSLTIERATKESLTARVYLRSRSVERALYREVTGGQRDKALEKLLSGIIPAGMFAVPGSEAKLTTEGKVSLSFVTKLVHKLGYSGNVSASGKRRRRSAASTQVFLLTEPRGRLRPGIYGRDGNKALPYLLFVNRASYAAKLPWFETAEQSVRKNIGAEFRKAVATAMRTAR